MGRILDRRKLTEKERRMIDFAETLANIYFPGYKKEKLTYEELEERIKSVLAEYNPNLPIYQPR